MRPEVLSPHTRVILTQRNRCREVQAAWLDRPCRLPSTQQRTLMWTNFTALASLFNSPYFQLARLAGAG